MAVLSQAVYDAAKGIAEYRGVTNLELVMPDALAAVVALEQAGHNIRADA